MTNISCPAQNCAYNRDSICYKSKINVEELFSRSKLGTFCESFKSPKERTLFEFELGSDMQDENLEPVETKTQDCYFNKNNRCTSQHIKVGNTDARFRSETECDSFRLK